MYLNKATIIGNLTRDPEMKTLPSGIKVTNFSLATNRVWKDQAGQKQEAVDYHNIVVFGRQAETSAQYLKKGSQAMVEGRMQTRSWDDAGSGKKMYRTEVVAESVQFGSRAQGVGNMTPQSENPVSAPQDDSEPDTIEYPEEDINPEDIPF
ncbi:single-stranded DNA-binding protein [Candidatus Campbellbacteria bacterium]|nr:single-stranded DNA-binding protein [Candidatus Campbellbacteria bacterium]|tara:strand:- start:362 stop:814 length:453 start_codon:yes stop_codon:yes gene_type:complete